MALLRKLTPFHAGRSICEKPIVIPGKICWTKAMRYASSPRRSSRHRALPKSTLCQVLQATQTPNVTRLAGCLVNAPDVQGPGWPGAVGGVPAGVAAASAFELAGPARAAPAFLPGSGAEFADGPA